MAPPEFRAMLAEIRVAVWRPELSIQEIPSPQRIAPHSVAVDAELLGDDEVVGTGRLVLLHDPAGNDAWGGTFRCVSFAKAEVEPEMVRDPLLADVGWSWLVEALDLHEAPYREPSGTISAVISTPFGGLADDRERAELEIRASWTPILTGGRGISTHLAAWQDLLSMTAGLPVTPPGVVPLQARRLRR
jgi:hypothetical protein